MSQQISEHSSFVLVCPSTQTQSTLNLISFITLEVLKGKLPDYKNKALNNKIQEYYNTRHPNDTKGKEREINHCTDGITQPFSLFPHAPTTTDHFENLTHHFPAKNRFPALIPVKCRNSTANKVGWSVPGFPGTTNVKLLLSCCEFALYSFRIKSYHHISLH